MSRERHQHRLNSVRDWDAPLDGETLHHCARSELKPVRRDEVNTLTSTLGASFSLKPNLAS
jgi:hypothetical protein